MLHRRMEMIHRALPNADRPGRQIRLAADRLTLAKRRWRGVSEDGCEFGFEVAEPLRDGDAFFISDEATYILAQKYESVLELSVASSSLRDGTRAARLGWLIGNLHFPIEIADELVRVADDPAVRQLFAREGFDYVICKRVFRPLSGAHHH